MARRRHLVPAPGVSPFPPARSSFIDPSIGAGESPDGLSTGLSVPRAGDRRSLARLFRHAGESDIARVWDRVGPMDAAWDAHRGRRLPALLQPPLRQLPAAERRKLTGSAAPSRRTAVNARLLQNLRTRWTPLMSPEARAADWRAFRSLPPLDRRTRVCVDRGIRKQVLFALGVAGKDKRLSRGSGGSYRRRDTSSLSCR